MYGCLLSHRTKITKLKGTVRPGEGTPRKVLSLSDSSEHFASYMTHQNLETLDDWGWSPFFFPAAVTKNDAALE